MTDAATGAAGASRTNDAAAIAAAAAAAAGAAGGSDTKGSGAAPGASAMGSVAEKPEDWIPEKYQVKDADGKIDEAKSARAIAKAHKELTARMVEVGLPPETSDKYELEGPKGFDVAEFRKDPQTADFLKGAHSQGMTNKQVNYVINKYLETAPGLVAGAQALSNDAVIAELGKVWATPTDLRTNMAAGLRAATTLAKSMGLTWEDFENAGLGNNVMFCRAMAALSTQMGEDGSLPAGTGIVPSDFESQCKAIDAELEKVPERDTKGRQALLDKKTALYNRRYPDRRAPALTG
jgi:hypothetical protein